MRPQDLQELIKPRRQVAGQENDEKPPLGTYEATKYARNWPMWWPEDTKVEDVDYVVVRKPKNLDEGLPHEVIVDFKYKQGRQP